MKNKSNLLMLVCLSILTFTSCNNDDDSIETMDPLTGSFMASDQTVMNGMITVSEVNMSEDGWIVVHRDNGNGGPMVPEIISIPEPVSEGMSSNVTIQLADGEEVSDGETLWIMLHTDNGIIGSYEFNGTNGLDAPIMDANGNIVTSPITVMMEMPTGSFMASDQDVMNNMVMVNSVNMSAPGWVVIHADNNGMPVVPEIISEPMYLEEGITEDVMVTLKESANIQDGEDIWIMLHTDTGTMGEYEFNGTNGLDSPIMNENGDVVTSPITVMTNMPTGMFTATDQAVVNNMITVNSITMNKSGWVVIHADNGGAPQVPEIISEPMYLEAGTTENVEVMFETGANVNTGDQVWIMLHTDTGTMGEYEFNGTNGLDSPIVDENGDVVVSPITIQ